MSADILLGALAEALLGVVISELASNTRLSGLRDKLRGGSLEKFALNKALASTYEKFSAKHPELTSSLFDDAFLKSAEVVSELAKILTPNQRPNNTALDLIWRSQFSQKVPMETTPAMAYFITTLENEVKAEHQLKPFTDSRALEQLYSILERVENQTDLQKQTVALLQDIRDLIRDGERSVRLASSVQPIITIENDSNPLVKQSFYRELREIIAQGTSKLVFVCGSDLNIATGSPSWQLLRKGLQTKLRNELGQLQLSEEEAKRRINEIAAIESEPNPWIAFQRIRRLSTDDWFRTAIRNSHAMAIKSPIPAVYETLWNFSQVHGLVNLTLVQVAERAFADIHPGRKINAVSSNQLDVLTYAIETPAPFILNLHGTEDRFDTWALTDDALQPVLSNSALLAAMSSIFRQDRVVFLGITEDDVADRGFLALLRKEGLDFKRHFWIKDRSSIKLDSWVMHSSVGIILHQTVVNAASEINTILLSLQKYAPEEPRRFTPVQSSQSFAATELPDAQSLTRLPEEQIRTLLNGRAQEILSASSEKSQEDYSNFVKEYSKAIHQAWYVDDNVQGYMLLGYKLEEEIAEGSFGVVYRASNSDGTQVALKLLRNEIRRKEILLQSFRRGVRAMKILKSRDVKGMVIYRDAFEIPALVVMDWIWGDNLRKALRTNKLTSWIDKLKLGVQLSDIIRKAHDVPEKVLHRDMRPENIMLQDDWDNDTWNVVVLDFDLSWYLGSSQESVRHKSETGYLAPEQVTTKQGISTRHSLVDSFGFGMTLFFIISGRDPVPFEHASPEWERTVLSACNNHRTRIWKSTPRRIARLIVNTTRDNQSERWDMNFIYTELKRLYEASSIPANVQYADLIVEELVERTDFFRDYVWDMNKQSAVIERPGFAVRISGNDIERQIEIRIDKVNTGSEDRSRVARHYQQTSNNIIGVLKSANWKVQSYTDHSAIRIEATITLDEARANLDKTAIEVDRALQMLGSL